MESIWILIFLILFMMLGGLTRSKARHGFLLLGTLLLTIQIMAFWLGGRGLDDRFWFHFNLRDILLGSTFLGWKRWLVLPLFLLIYLILYQGSRWLSAQPWTPKSPKSFLIPLAILLVAIPMYLGVNQSLFSHNHRTNNSVKENLAMVGFDSETYIFPDEIDAKTGKNVIIIYLESLEKAYFHPAYNHLIPNLKELSNSWQFRTMKSGVGSDWSAASFYTSIYGLPAFFSLGSHGNSIFHKTKEVNLTGTGHVYEAAGYRRFFMLGNKAFAGLEDMLNASRYEVLSEIDFQTQHATVPWGLHDIDLFTEAKELIKAQSKSGNPFVLQMATIGSHGPNGFYDPRVESIIPEDVHNNMEKMVYATDYLVGDLIQFLRDEGYIENTVLYIMPDHLLMGPTNPFQKYGKERTLFLLTNSESPLSDTIHQIELPAITLKGSGIRHNAQFLSDHLPKNNVNDYLLKHKEAIQQLHKKAVRGDHLADGFSIKRQHNQIIIQNDYTKYPLDRILQEGKVHCITLDHKFRIQKDRNISIFAAFNEPDPTLYPRLVLEEKNDRLYAALLYGNQKIVAKQGIDEVEFTAEDIELLRQWPYSPSFYQLPKTPQYLNPDEPLLVTSSIPQDAQVLTPSQIILDGKKLPLSKMGIYMIQRDGRLRYFNPESQTDLEQLRKLSRQIDDFRCIMVHGNGRGMFNEILIESGLVKLSNIGENMAYVAYPYNGMISEYTAKWTLSFSISNPVKKLNYENIIAKWSKDKSRFIAHAGGSINGLRYTNSLEALNRAYDNGFRLFELDIVQTSDGHYVAAHDWNMWHQFTGLPGSESVTRQQFINQPILDQYTPLDMSRINQWFSEHADAVLITDKINDPVTFSKIFRFPDRLMMELFSQEAIEQAVNLGIEPIPSQQVIQVLGGKTLDFLQRFGIKKVGMSIPYFRHSTQLVEQLYHAGIHIYLYQLNNENHINESFVLLNYLPKAYGMYAEDWKF